MGGSLLVSGLSRDVFQKCAVLFSSSLLLAPAADTAAVVSLCRHPSNLMLERLSGRILHIDFGDCFEVSVPLPIG